MSTGNDDDVLAAALLQLSGQAEQLADLRTQVPRRRPPTSADLPAGTRPSLVAAVRE